jgi:predicted lactoylglutathione lyase
MLMTKEFWLNLPVKDLQKSKEFFAQLGFTFHPRHEHSEELAGMFVGHSPVIIMLFPESAFQGFTNNEIADTTKGTLLMPKVEKKWTKCLRKQSKQVEPSIVSLRTKAGCTAAGSLIWTAIVGTYCTWIKAKCHRRKPPCTTESLEVIPRGIFLNPLSFTYYKLA